MSASFHADEEGPRYQRDVVDVPGPETVPHWRELDVLEPYRAQLPWQSEEPAFDLRFIDEPMVNPDSGGARDPRSRIWFRTSEDVPEGDHLHVALMVYASDMVMIDTTLRPHGLSWFDQSEMHANIDHALWLHRPFRADEWLLFDLSSPWTGNARGLAVGALYTPEGVIAASMTQERLLRPR